VTAGGGPGGEAVMLPRFQKPSTDVVFTQHCNVRDNGYLRRSGLPRKVEHALEGRQFAVDGGILRSLLLSTINILSYKLTGYLNSPKDTKEWPQMQFPTGLKVVNRFSTINAVFTHEIDRQFGNEHSFQFRAQIRSGGDRGQARP
jgi:hypothetical protein